MLGGVVGLGVGCGPGGPGGVGEGFGFGLPDGEPLGFAAYPQMFQLNRP